ncbi:hypothetical protein ACLOJK_004774 [Asimina triloba]
MARKTFCYTNYSPTAVALATKENWLSLVAATTTSQPLLHQLPGLFPRSLLHRFPSLFKRPLLLLLPATSTAASMTATRPLQKAIATATTSAPRPLHKAATRPAAGTAAGGATVAGRRRQEGTRPAMGSHNPYGV